MPIDRTCSVDDCTAAVRARGLCRLHYQRWRRSVTPDPPMTPKQRERHRAKGREWREKNRDRKNATNKAWQKANRDRVNAARRAHRRNNPELTRQRYRHEDLRRHFGITAAEYDAMSEAQGGTCAICRRPCPTGRRLAVDHCHSTGKVRGLLCAKCNRALGMMDDDPGLLAAAIEYLAHYAA